VPRRRLGKRFEILAAIPAREQSSVSANEPTNDFVNEGGMTRFCLAEPGHHYVVYSMSGNPRVRATGEQLHGAWYDPSNPEASLGPAFAIEPGDREYEPPDPSRDWVLWITDGTNLNPGRTHPASLLSIVRLKIQARVAHSR
jgi:hypothetical protein